ncbi:MAG: cytochrome c [Gammaproteobacteria bacterium]|nr:cytochrome c [Gammaproteobacteria bacterium]
MRTRTGLKMLVLCLGTLATASAFAAGDAEAGRSKAFTCMGCHGVPSYTNAYPTYHVPKLGGQHAQYLVSALQSYKSGQRSHGTMRAQAANLSDQDMEDIAAYFASRTE